MPVPAIRSSISSGGSFGSPDHRPVVLHSSITKCVMRARHSLQKLPDCATLVKSLSPPPTPVRYLPRRKHPQFDEQLLREPVLTVVRNIRVAARRAHCPIPGRAYPPLPAATRPLSAGACPSCRTLAAPVADALGFGDQNIQPHCNPYYFGATPLACGNTGPGKNAMVFASRDSASSTQYLTWSACWAAGWQLWTGPSAGVLAP